MGRGRSDTGATHPSRWIVTVPSSTISEAVAARTRRSLSTRPEAADPGGVTGAGVTGAGVTEAGAV